MSNDSPSEKGETVLPRKTITTLAAAWMLAFPPLNAWGAVQAQKAVAPKKKVVTVTTTVTGPSVKCRRWGQLVVAIKVKKTTTTIGTRSTVALKILDVTWPTWPQATFRSVYINTQALPLLRDQVLQDQSPKVETISGATNITDSFKESLEAALLAAKK
jgi:uncharacterized protein with FMN-binding domain